MVETGVVVVLATLTAPLVVGAVIGALLRARTARTALTAVADSEVETEELRVPASTQQGFA